MLLIPSIGNEIGSVLLLASLPPRGVTNTARGSSGFTTIIMAMKNIVMRAAGAAGARLLQRGACSNAAALRGPARWSSSTQTGFTVSVTDDEMHEVPPPTMGDGGVTPFLGVRPGDTSPALDSCMVSPDAHPTWKLFRLLDEDGHLVSLASATPRPDRHRRRADGDRRTSGQS